MAPDCSLIAAYPGNLAAETLAARVRAAMGGG
jgi:hypothetical protein